jgi:hypothetical protein
MRKMPYTLIFLAILVILVFAGCKAFSHTPDDDTDLSSEESVTSTTVAEESATFPQNPEAETNAAGETVYTPEEASSIREALTSIAQSSAAASETQSAANASSAAATTAPTTTAAPSTTAAPTTAAPGTTAAPTTQTPSGTNTGKTQYDILRSGKFYLDGSMYADGETNPITLAVGDDLVYMQATMDGATMGLLVADKKTYLLNPVQKTYCEFGSMMSSLLQQAGMMSEDEIMEFIDNMGFTKMEDLDKADVTTTGTIGSTACDVYIFNKSDGTKTRVYMNGDRLMALETVDASGVVDSATYITTLTDNVPTLPPKDYSKQNVISFISSMEDILGD